MALTALAYIGLTTSRMDEWTNFATRLLGMQQVDATRSTVAFRMDDRQQRLFLDVGRDLASHLVGWECGEREDLDRLGARLEASGARVMAGSRSLAEQRRVADLIVFDDPLGNRMEICWRPECADTPFVGGRPVSGFLTGALGMGHVVMHVENVEPLLPFYRDTLGFALSDYVTVPYPVYFFHLNARHHSFAMVGSGRRGLHHFMVEMTSLDDVGQGYDLALLEPDRVAYTLGRHTNDYMTSFYARSPSDFYVEYGWGGRNIDVANWTAQETIEGPSFWGHDRLALAPALRERFRDLRLDAAARGLRAPL